MPRPLSLLLLLTVALATTLTLAAGRDLATGMAATTAARQVAIDALDR